MTSLTAPKQCHVAIVGAGLSGSLLFCHLVQQLSAGIHVVLIERSEAFAHGVAYGTTCDAHLLNVPAGKMTAFAEDADHFLNWLRAIYPDVAPYDFVPRRLYGQYLQGCLQHAMQQAQKRGVQVTLLADDVTDITTSEGVTQVNTQSGAQWQAQQVVLALGNAPATEPGYPKTDFYQHARFIQNPWQADAFTPIQPDDTVLLVGTGLTSVDVVLALHQKFLGNVQPGRIYALSRLGKLPAVHADTPLAPYSGLIDWSQLKTTRAVFHTVRKQIGAGEADWRQVIDGLRPHTQALWQQLNTEEQRRFLRHVRTYWDRVRHRMAPQVGQKLSEALKARQLVLLAGRIQQYTVQRDHVQVVYRPHSSLTEQTLRVNWVINCSGSGPAYHRRQDALVQTMLQAGLLVPDPAGNGLRANTHFALLNIHGEPSPCLTTLGPPLKGLLWESTAAPEIRVQAQQLAQQLAHRLQASDTSRSVSEY